MVFLAVMTLPDILAAIPKSQRLAREQADARYLMSSQDSYTASDASKAIAKAAIGDSAEKLKIWDGSKDDGETVIICGRCDLDHEIIFPDNVFIDCDDCGCGLQRRPDTPKGDAYLCVCCAARRAKT